MIAKISRGASVRGLANYLHGPGKANEHVYEGVPGGRVIGGTLGAEGALDGSRWATDMATVMGQRPDVEKPVWHMSLRLPAKDRTLSDAEWRDVAQEMGERMGWAENPWVMVRHGQDHVHVVVSRAPWTASCGMAVTTFGRLRRPGRASSSAWACPRRPQMSTTVERGTVSGG